MQRHVLPPGTVTVMLSPADTAESALSGGSATAGPEVRTLLTSWAHELVTDDAPCASVSDTVTERDAATAERDMASSASDTASSPAITSDIVNGQFVADVAPSTWWTTSRIPAELSSVHVTGPEMVGKRSDPYGLRVPKPHPIVLANRSDPMPAPIVRSLPSTTKTEIEPFASMKRPATRDDATIPKPESDCIDAEPLAAVARGMLICLEHFDKWRPTLQSSDEDV